MEQTRFAAAYLRVSTNEQAEFSPDAQLSAIRDFAKKNGYIILPDLVFIDEGISGRRAEKRPAFMKMIALAKQKPAPFEAILVHKIDRFARSREDSVVYKSLLRRECGVRVISITENIEDDKFSVILEAMLEAMAEYYSLNLSEEVKKGMTEKAKRGGLQSAPSFGYAVRDNVLVPIPDEAEIVKQIFDRFVAGEGYFPIARSLNDMGVKTHRGSRFENRTIEYIIRNPVYIGKLRWNPSGKTKRGDFDNPDIMLVDGKHEALIDISTWDAAQQRVLLIKAQWRKHWRPATEHKDWLSGLIRCSSCNRSLVKTSAHYWKCGGYAKGTCQHSQHITDEKLKSMVMDCLKKETRNAYRLDYVEMREGSPKTREYEIALSRLSKIKVKLDRIKDAYVNGIDSLEDYKDAKSRIEAERAELEHVLIELQKPVLVDHSSIIRKGLANIVVLLDSSDVSVREKHRIAHDAIKEIIFDKIAHSLEITYFLPL